MKKAFTLVEIMIVVVIIGLLAAMAVPAYVNVKTNGIAKRIYLGQTVSKEEYAYLQERIEMVEEKYLTKRVKQVEAEAQTMPEAPSSTVVVIVNGKRYKLIPE